MILKIIEFCAKNRALTLSATALALIAGGISLKGIPVDALPDLSDTQVIVYSKWNVSPDIIEDQVTYPVVSGLLGLPRVKDVRGLSSFGASYTHVVFEDGVDIYWARARVAEALAEIIPRLPKEARTALGPAATGTGWIYQYALKDLSGKRNLADLRAFQDFYLKYRLQSVPGVAEIASFGGFESQYQVQVNPDSLRAYNIPLSKVIQAVRRGNSEAGARVIEFSGTEYIVRAKGLAKTRQDIENIVVQSRKGVPVYIKNLARVSRGPEMRRGVADLNGTGDVAGGIIVMRFGENAAKVIQRVEERLKDIKASLPPGLEIIETYNRRLLIKKAVSVLKSKLSAEIAVTALILFLFLLHIPSALVPALILPAAVVISFIFMRLAGVSANIMSLGGIAVAVGAMADAALVITENCHKHIERRKKSDGALNGVILQAIKEVGPAAFFSLLVIAVSFLPILALEAEEGRLFRPLAYTKTFAVAAAAILSITAAPALLSLLFEKGVKEERGLRGLFFGRKALSEEHHPLSRFLRRIYSPAASFLLDHRKKTVAGAAGLVLLTAPLFFKLGKEFMPPLNEGAVLYMPVTMPGVSVTEISSLLQKQGALLKKRFPEVLTVHGKAGRAETATDPAPLSMIETVIALKDQKEWRRKRRRGWGFLPEGLARSFPLRLIAERRLRYEELIGEMDAVLDFPGLSNGWTQPIKGRTDMLATGIRTPLGLKISGPDLQEIEKLGLEAERILRPLKETRSVFAERISKAFFLDFHFKREALARHGISIKQAQDSLRAALGGVNATTVIDGRERISVNVRYNRGFRQNKEDLKRILLDSPKGYQIPLSEAALIKISQGPGLIRNENGLLTGYVHIDLASTDIGGFAEKAKKLLNEELAPPEGYSLSFSGRYESLQRVREKLKIALPLTLAVILILIFLNTGSFIKTGIILLSVPFSAIGAVLLLHFLDYNMSVAVWAGFIALLGLDAETAVYMLLYLDLAYEKKLREGGIRNFADLKGAVMEGAVQRIRPKMMTALTAFAALLPILLAGSHETGADIMKRMAAPLAGGIFTSFLMELLVYPALFALWKERELFKKPGNAKSLVS